MKRTLSKRSNDLKEEKRGFTLAEIALTLAILGIALLPLIALMGVASKTSYDADSKAISASIASDLFAQVQQAEASQIEDWEANQIDYFFDFEGLPLESSEVADAAFTARISVNGDPMIFGASVSNPFVKKVLVLVSVTPGALGSTKIDEAIAEIRSGSSTKPSGSVLTFSTHVTRLDK